MKKFNKKPNEKICILRSYDEKKKIKRVEKRKKKSQ